jgi:hypothetical protein
MPPSLPLHSPFALSDYQRSFLESLVKSDAAFLVIGAVAMAQHGHVRETRDLDLWIDPNVENAPKVLRALDGRFRNRPAALTEAWLSSPDKRLPLPSDEEKELDLLTTVGALSFSASTRLSKAFVIGGLSLRALGLVELIYSKILSANSNIPQAAKEREANDFVSLLELLPPPR